MRENGEEIREFDVAYFTASCDSPQYDKKFAESLDLDYAILSDPGRKIAEAYGVVTAKRKYPFRWTFYIGKDGKLLHLDKKVKRRLKSVFSILEGERISVRLL